MNTSSGSGNTASPALANSPPPLPGRTLLLPRILSNATDGPYLGEAAVLYTLSRQASPAVTATATTNASLPGMVFMTVGAQLLLGSLFAFLAIRSLRRRQRKPPSAPNLGIIPGPCRLDAS